MDAPKFFIEKDLFIDETEMVKLLTARGIPYSLLSYIEFLKHESPTRGFVHAGIRTCKFTQKHYGINSILGEEITGGPGAVANFPQFEWAHYAPYFDSSLLNHVWFMLPAREVKRQFQRICAYWQSDEIFIRPNSGCKPFIGQKVKGLKGVEYALSECPDDVLVIVAPAQKIYGEYRFIVRGHEVITGCQYMDEGKIAISPAYMRVAQEFAVATASSLSSDCFDDPLWVMDLCETDSGVHLLECNSLSCSDFYVCDVNRVIDEIIKL